MNSYDVLRNTIFIAVPVAVLVFLILYGFGYSGMALGFLFGATGGMGKSFIMTYSVIHGSSSVKAFFFRYLVIGIVFVCAILISTHAFYAAVAGVFFVHVVFITDQVRASKIGELR